MKKDSNKTPSKKKKERFFITGGMGYIGSAFAIRALEKDHEVCLYDSLIYEQNVSRMISEIVRNKKNLSHLKIIIGDTRNTELLKSSLIDFRPSYVLHLGELSSVYACNHHPAFTDSVNYGASKKVMDICEELDLKVLYNSTSSVYGTQREFRLMKEDDKLPESADHYCRYKLKMEDYIKNKVNKNPNFKIIIFRPATVFGLSPRFRIELLPNHFTYLAVSRKLINVSDFNAYRAAIDLQTLIDGYFKVIGKGTWKHLIYNIGHHNLSKRQFAERIQKVAKCTIGSAPDIGDLRNLQIDCSLFNQEFDFHPEISFEDSVKKIAVWLKKNKDKIENSNFAEMLNMTLDKWLHICN